jgi:hypothetical protein
MAKVHPIAKELIAPCGMNCAVCSRYLAYLNGLKKSQCIGCRPQNEPCTYLFKDCEGPANIAEGNAGFCYECDAYPCKQIERMDKRYRENYHMSIKENLEFIQEKGIDRFLKEQYRKYRCKKCGGLISVHNRKCFHCEAVTHLVVKYK